MSDSGDSEAQTSSTANLAEGAEGGKSSSKKKLIRLLTVMAYVSSVSGTAFMLSMYYLFLWEPKVAEHHLKADPMGHQALALKGHSHYDGIYDTYPVPGAYRPPVATDGRVLAGMYPAPVGSSPSGGYWSTAMGPPLPPMGTPGRPVPRYDYQHQDSVPAWGSVHSAYAPSPPRPPSLSQVREPGGEGESLLDSGPTTIARARRARPSTPSSASEPSPTPTPRPALNSTRQTTAVATAAKASQTDTEPTKFQSPTPGAPVLTAAHQTTPSSTWAAPSTSTPSSGRAPPNLTVRRQSPGKPPGKPPSTSSQSSGTLRRVAEEAKLAPRLTTMSPRKKAAAKKTPPLLSPGASQAPSATPRPAVLPAMLPTALLLSAAGEASILQPEQGAPQA